MYQYWYYKINLFLFFKNQIVKLKYYRKFTLKNKALKIFKKFFKIKKAGSDKKINLWDAYNGERLGSYTTSGLF